MRCPASSIYFSCLAKKDTWYDYGEMCSGLYIQVYAIDEMFSLWIGVFSTNDVPMYIYLQTNAEPEERVEIRMQEVSDFIGAHPGATESNVYQVQFPAHEFGKT